MKKGVDTVADAVKTTLGPRGRNVALERKPHAPLITHDGVTVAKDIELVNPFENMGAMLIRHLVWRVFERTGDGTATAAVLAEVILTAATQYITAGGDSNVIR